MICPWCKRPFEPRADGGSPKQFCSLRCRRALDRAGRLWLRRALADGRVEMDHRLRRLPDGRLTTEFVGFRWAKGAARA
jgi:hypothetical protein